LQLKKSVIEEKEEAVANEDKKDNYVKTYLQFDKS
jgi:hypothetical protein